MITLHPITVDDTDFMIELVHDPETTRFVPGLITDREMMRVWIEKLDADDHEFIVLKDHMPVGECNLAVRGNTAEIGFLLLSQYWRHGYGTEMMTQLMELAEDLGIEEITAMTDRENEGAIHLLERAGFSRKNIGWLLRIPEDEDDPDLSGMGQSVISFRKVLSCSLGRKETQTDEETKKA